MHSKIITLCYRKIIDAKNLNPWDQFVHKDSFTEFKLKAPYYNQDEKYTSFAEILHNVKGAENLHFLVSSSIAGYVQQLNNIVPDILDNLGRRFLTFENFRFEIINSDITNISRHKIAINFFTNPLVWHSTINNQLLVSQYKEIGDTEIFTNLFQVQPFVSIYSVSPIV